MERASTWATLLLLLSVIAVSFPTVSSRRLNQMDRLPGEEGLTDSELAAKRWLESFVQRTAQERVTQSRVEEVEEVVEEAEEEQEETRPQIRGSQVLIVEDEADQWVPRCNATLDPAVVFLAEVGKYSNQPAERVTRFVPTEYEVMPYVEMKTRSAGVRQGQVAVRGLGLDVNVLVGERTNPVRRICGVWSWTDSGVYSWQVYADANSEVELAYYYRRHNNNGAAAGAMGAYREQEIDLRGRSGLIASGNRNNLNQNTNSDLQGRSGRNAIEFDNRVAGEVNKLSNQQVLGPVGYRLGRG